VLDFCSNHSFQRNGAIERNELTFSMDGKREKIHIRDLVMADD
jgi:hypothetical protein